MTETNSKPETNGVPNPDTPSREVELSRDAVRYLVKLTDMDRNPNEVPDLIDELNRMSIDLAEGQFDSSETVRLQSTTAEVLKRHLSNFVEPDVDIDLLFDDEYWEQLREANTEARRALAEQ